MNRFLFSCVEVVAALVLSYSCIQEPKTIPVTGVTWDCTSLEMMVGESTTIMATVSPRDASNPNVVVSSSNGSVARVSSIISVDKELSFSESRWTISALSPGEAVISVITDEGRKTATCSVTVKEKPIPVKGISLSYASSKLVKGEKLQLSAEVYPQNATNKRISWSSDKPEIAQVDENGLVSGISAGVVHIIAVTEDGDSRLLARLQ